MESGSSNSFRLTRRVGFRVDVETDSTVEMDAGQTQEARTEFLQSAGNFLNNILPVMQTVPDLVPVAGEMLLFTVRGYRARDEPLRAPSSKPCKP